MNPDYFNHICTRIREAKRSGETDTKLGRVLSKWHDIDIPVGRDGRWLCGCCEP